MDRVNDLQNGWPMPAEWTAHAATWMCFPHNRAVWESDWRVTLRAVQGVMGMPGFTAYMGLLEIGQPKTGETVVVAAASGAVA